MTSNIVYKTIDDKGLLDFCKNHLTMDAMMVLGIIQDTDGTIQIEKKNYMALVQIYMEVGALIGGDFDNFDKFIDLKPNVETDTII